MSPMDELRQIMRRLRDPRGGCPWDLEQDFHSIAPYTLEEAYEVADAIQRGDMGDLREELGDLLFQVVYHAQMAEEAEHFDFDQVARGIARKLVRRHPHVFGEARETDAASQTRSWEAIKAAERAEKGEAASPSALDGVTLALPGLQRAVKLQRRAARVGFDWDEALPVLDKIREETAEVEAEIRAGAPRELVEEELGDLLFACANLARHMDIDPEAALRRSNAKFERRFRAVEAEFAHRGQDMREVTLAELDKVWEQVKREERSPPP
ncbi:nucleoside triphosphate pyrophosphohydrolase [Alkalilimnicola sp. S0819]|uniref:nucleoside triphosphate pyrophosphohydrolase n=1 Tax=Alkalilimnicola sp. S0819 TaxID=2613922 RepID=UPI0012621250|nr:nucleoside triphosphate pyrophosphohydrolase [Alkalilimnicola sp. S0819]KAB7619575.1 nucleoside triphosphate pyrophosphohydrolase [Alkalilimnicola sp. S0819]MPQ17628.1 nucleoside triphosphate pyrophosphohydrolase [Alkalilimnicola sp. S0819]